VTPLRIVWRTSALDPDSGLSAIARLAACVYAEFANGDGVLDPAPSARTIAEHMSTSDRWARKARRDLEDGGWLDVRRRQGRASRIRFLVPELRNPASVVVRNSASEDLGTDLGSDYGSRVPPNKRNKENKRGERARARAKTPPKKDLIEERAALLPEDGA
jgi:hypothetical protein